MNPTAEAVAVRCPSCDAELGLIDRAGTVYVGTAAVARGIFVCTCGRAYHVHGESDKAKRTQK